MRHPCSSAFLIALLTFGLFGCASHPPQTTAVQQRLSFEVEGKIAVTTPNERSNATFNWQQTHNDYRLRLFGPFGLGTVWLIKEGKQVWFENQEQGKFTASSAEQLMRKHLGWQLPVSDLRYWIQGLISPNAPASLTLRNPQGQLTQLTQLGWQMEFSQYQALGSQWLPGKIIAQQNGIKVIIIPKVWITPPTP